MQFLSGTWDEYGVDGNKDGKKDRWNPEDEIPGAANNLKASGAPKDWDRAIFAYNHSSQYVADVKHWASLYRGNLLRVGVPSRIVASSTSARALVDNPRITLTPSQKNDLLTGQIDSRLIDVLGMATQKWKLTICALKSDHSDTVAGRPGVFSNHHYGRAADVCALDGKGCLQAAQLCFTFAKWVARIGGKLQPTEIIFKWDADGSGTNAFVWPGHEDHVHVGFRS